MFILLPIILAFTMQQPVLTCKLTTDTSGICKPAPDCVGCATHTLARINWNARHKDGTKVYEAWLWRAPEPQNYNFPLEPRVPRAGQLLRATTDKFGKLQPLPDCAVAEWIEANKRAREKPGEWPGMVGLPEGCPLRFPEK